MRFKIFQLFIVLALGILLVLGLTASKKEKPAKHEKVDFSISCVECHAEVTPDAVADWKKSAHGVMGFGCYMCHGDGEEEFYAKPTADRCVSCHDSKDVHWEKSPVNNCFDCHKGHTLKFHNE